MDISRFIKWGDRPSPIGGGGFGDVFKCSMSGEAVAVKVIRSRSYDDSDETFATLNRRIDREKKSWRTLEHINVLELLGTCYEPNQTGKHKLPCFVSPWMNGGTARYYLRDHADADFLAFTLGIAKGIQYLHRHDVVHGDIRGANILVDVDPVTGVVPKVADFGLSRIVRVNPEEMTVTNNWNNGGHWSPPEYLDYNEERSYVGPDHPTKAGDTWMFSMTILELFGDQHPFFGLENAAVTLAIHKKEIPTIPQAQHEEFAKYESYVFTLCAVDFCWDFNPSKRPSMSAIVKFLQNDDSEDTEDDERETSPIAQSLRKRQMSYSSISTSSGVNELGPGCSSPSPVRRDTFGPASIDTTVISRDFEARPIKRSAAQNILPSIKSEPEEYGLNSSGSSDRGHSPITLLKPPPSPFALETHGSISNMTMLSNYANKCGSVLNVSESMVGSAHAPNWTVEITVDGSKYGLGQHSKKKRAQEEAAKQTLEMLGDGKLGLQESLPKYLPVFKAYLRDNGLEDYVKWPEPISTGPSHATKWTSTVTMSGHEIARATDKKKDIAMEEAAKMAALSFNQWP